MTSSPTSSISSVAVGIPRLHVAAERPSLQLSQVHGQRRHAADERGADVGPARGREQPGVGADLVVDPLKALGRQRRAGRADRAQAAQISLPAAGHRHLGLHARGDERGARAERRDLRLGAQLPQTVKRRIAGVAVEQHHRGVGQQHADEEVPHHPAGRREPEHAVAGARVDVQLVVLELLEQDPALALDDRLRQAGRTGAVQHPQRVVERHLRERQLGIGRAEKPVLPAAAVQVAEADDLRQPAHLGGDPLDDLRAVEVLAAVAVAIDRQQHLGLDLHEPVDHAARAELGRRRGPDRTDRRARQQARDRLGDVRHVGADAVALADAERPQTRGDPRRLLAQLAPGPAGELGTGLGGVQDRDLVVVATAEDVLGIGDGRARKPLRPRHRCRSASTVSPPAPKRTSKYSTIVRQNSSSSATDQRHISS